MGEPRTGVGPRSAATADWEASTLILAPGEVGIADDTGVQKIGNGTDLWGDLEASGGATNISHYEASWINGDFADAPEVINTGGGDVIDVALGTMNDNGFPGINGIRSLTLPLGIYFVSWGGYTGTPDTEPDPEDPVTYGEWRISWDNSEAGLGQTASTVAVVATGAPNVPGSLFKATASMVAPIADAEDVLSITVVSPYGGINDTFTGYLAITKIG